MPDSSCASFGSRIAVPVPLSSQKPCRTLWGRTLSLRRVSMIASITFHRNYNRPIPRVYIFSFVIRTRILHPSSLGISPGCHMSWLVSNIFCHRFGLGGVDVSSTGYASRINFLKFYAQKFLFPLSLWSCIRRTAASTTLCIKCAVYSVTSQIDLSTIVILPL